MVCKLVDLSTQFMHGGSVVSIENLIDRSNCLQNSSCHQINQNLLKQHAPFSTILYSYFNCSISNYERKRWDNLWMVLLCSKSGIIVQANITVQSCWTILWYSIVNGDKCGFPRWTSFCAEFLGYIWLVQFRLRLWWLHISLWYVALYSFSSFH